MYLRPNHRGKDGKDHTYWSLVETVRTPDGPRQRTLCYLGELNSSAQARWLRTVEVFNAQGEREIRRLLDAIREATGKRGFLEQDLGGKQTREQAEEQACATAAARLWMIC